MTGQDYRGRLPSGVRYYVDMAHAEGQRRTDAPRKGAARPLADHNELEQQLQASIERYELLARATNDAIYDMDIQAGSVSWNDALYSAYGYARTEACSTLEWWANHVHPDDALDVEAGLTRLLLSNRHTWVSDYRFLKADGSYAHVRNRAFVQRGAGGEPIRIIGSLFDMTHEKQLDRAKDEFISLVSHQLRTPLTIIRLFSDMLASGRTGPLNDRQKNYAEKISAASVRMIALVGDILNISRIELDRLKIEPTPIDVNVLIETQIEELRPLIRGKNLRLRFAPSKTSEPLPVDPLIFSQIVHNLLTNAIRYTEAGKGVITVRFSRQKTGYVLSVRDNGIGIPTRAQPLIFTRFYRAENAASMIGEGSGLGLYLVKIIADICKGKVWFKCAEDKGSIFYVRLPLIGMTARSGASRFSRAASSPSAALPQSHPPEPHSDQPTP